MPEEQTVTPWEVSAGAEGVDYDKLVRQWGAKLLTPEHLAQTAEILGDTPHVFLRRQLFYAHRDFSRLLDIVANHNNAAAREAHGHTFPFFLYTGRGPSSGSLHMGHLIPMRFTAWLQRAFRVPCVIQLTDDEKYIWKDNLDIDDLRTRIAKDNAAEIAAAGFIPELTFIFQDTERIDLLADVVSELDARNSFHTLEKVFGFDKSGPAFKPVFPSIQMSPCFLDCFVPLFARGDETEAELADLRARLRATPCLVPCAIDQDPYFRALRPSMPAMGAPPVSLLLSKFLPSLAGAGTKMSASSASSAIYVCDDDATIAGKINAAWSADCPDAFVEWLHVFLDDDVRYEKLAADAASGDAERVDGVRKALIEIVTDEIAAFRDRRAAVTPARLQEFFSDRKNLDRVEWTVAK